MAVEMYRMGTGIKSGAASWGTSKHFESQVALEDALILALVQVERENARGPIRRLFDFWAGRLGESNPHKRVTRIHHVQKLVDGEWVPVEYEFTPPALIIKEPS